MILVNITTDCLIDSLTTMLKDFQKLEEIYMETPATFSVTSDRCLCLP